MGTFSIKDIEAVSGIKCHTLRIWEQRYGIIAPKRTDTNIRFYDDNDLKYVLNISILNRHGYKISEIAKMTRTQINDAIIRICGHSTSCDGHVKGLISAMMMFDEYSFHRILTTNIIQTGLEQTMHRVVFPFLNEAGILWQVGSIHPSHEHFASNIIKQKLYVAIDGNVGRYADNRKKFLLFLPENEQHCIGLLFANYMLRARGQEVLYLGQEVPLEDLHDASGRLKPDYVLTMLTSSHMSLDKQDFVNELASIWPSAQLLLSGPQFLQDDIAIPQNAKVIRNLTDFASMIDGISAGQAV